MDVRQQSKGVHIERRKRVLVCRDERVSKCGEVETARRGAAASLIYISVRSAYSLKNHYKYAEGGLICGSPLIYNNLLNKGSRPFTRSQCNHSRRRSIAINKLSASRSPDLVSSFDPFVRFYFLCLFYFEAWYYPTSVVYYTVLIGLYFPMWILTQPTDNLKSDSKLNLSHFIVIDASAFCQFVDLIIRITQLTLDSQETDNLFP